MPSKSPKTKHNRPQPLPFTAAEMEALRMADESLTGPMYLR